MRKTLRSVLLLIGFPALWLGLSSGCDATTSEPACERLQKLSCECFPHCQRNDTQAIDSGDAERCNDHVRAHHDYWSVCSDNCTVDCELGWGNCALEIYREIGLDPQNSCSPGARECERLRRLSCECFPECQWGDQAVIDSQDAQACDTRVSENHSYWSSSCDPCAENCEYGWGGCAFQVYEQLGLAVQNACGPAADAG